MEIKQIKGPELSHPELEQVNNSIYSEFKVAPMTQDNLKDKLFFLLKDSDTILAMGAVWEVTPVIFDGQIFTLGAFLEVIANEKRKGYGKKIVVAMREYVHKKGLTSFGFTMPKNAGFYEKCGMNIETNSTHRFVYVKNGERITNKDGQVIFYKDGTDKFMEKIISKKPLEVNIPTEGMW